MYKDYDKNNIYEEEISPLVDELKRICNEEKIPCFMAFGTKMDNGTFEKGTGIRCTALIPEVLSIDSEDPFFAEFINVVNGASTTYSETPEYIVEDEEDGDNGIDPHRNVILCDNGLRREIRYLFL